MMRCHRSPAELARLVEWLDALVESEGLLSILRGQQSNWVHGALIAERWRLAMRARAGGPPLCRHCPLLQLAEQQPRQALAGVTLCPLTEMWS